VTRPPVDLHPADGEARRALREQLRHARLNLNIPTSHVANALGITRGAVTNYELTAENPSTATLQRYARAIQHRLVITAHLTPDLPVHPATANLQAMAANTEDPTTADMYSRSALLTHLIAHRRWLGLSGEDIAVRSGMARKGGAVSEFEADLKDAKLGTYQRYARALGGWLEMALEPVNPDPNTNPEGETP
jgi:transcriptional regulator with XRE-family HTH domain